MIFDDHLWSDLKQIWSMVMKPLKHWMVHFHGPREYQGLLSMVSELLEAPHSLEWEWLGSRSPVLSLQHWTCKPCPKLCVRVTNRGSGLRSDRLPGRLNLSTRRRHSSAQHLHLICLLHLSHLFWRRPSYQIAFDQWSLLLSSDVFMSSYTAAF
jgi:hypothetical protein